MLTIKYFTAPWCGPCKMFGPVFDEVIGKTGVPHIKVNVDLHTEMAQQYNVTSVPTILFERDGDVVYRQSGVMSRGQLIELIGKFS